MVTLQCRGYGRSRRADPADAIEPGTSVSSHFFRAIGIVVLAIGIGLVAIGTIAKIG
jgi:hypothetical protein